MIHSSQNIMNNTILCMLQTSSGKLPGSQFPNPQCTIVYSLPPRPVALGALSPMFPSSNTELSQKAICITGLGLSHAQSSSSVIACAVAC